MRLDPDLERLSAAQHACVATWQLRHLGATQTEIARLRRGPRFRSHGEHVLIVNGSPTTQLQQACAAALDGGPSAVLSHRSAAALWDIGARYTLLPAHVSRGRELGSHLRAGDAAHPIAGLIDRWTTVLDGIPVVRPELCIYELCGTEHPLRAERALDAAWATGLVSFRSLHACLSELRKRGRNGTLVLEALLDARGEDHRPPESGLEARFARILSERGIRGFRRQVDAGGSELWIGRVDFRHHRLPVIVEVQSRRHHAALSYRRDDSARLEALRAAGFRVVEVWDDEVWFRPDDAAERVREAVQTAERAAA